MGFVVITVAIAAVAIWFDGAHRSGSNLHPDGLQRVLGLRLAKTHSRFADLDFDVGLVPTAQQHTAVVSGIERQLAELRGVKHMLFFAARDGTIVAADPEMSSAIVSWSRVVVVHGEIALTALMLLMRRAHHARQQHHAEPHKQQHLNLSLHICPPLFSYLRR